jgi:hypothetical protein
MGIHIAIKHKIEYLTAQPSPTDARQFAARRYMIRNLKSLVQDIEAGAVTKQEAEKRLRVIENVGNQTAAGTAWSKPKTLCIQQDVFAGAFEAVHQKELFA